MGFVGGSLGYSILKAIAPRKPSSDTAGDPVSTEPGHLKLELFFGDDFFDRIRDRTVIDFGSGEGKQSVEMARRGARRVIGLDILERRFPEARRHAESLGVADRCEFTTRTEEPADFIVSKDAFEHFEDPAAVLRQMSGLLKPDGRVLASFGPTWLHPYGGHLFSVFPWSHLLFTEAAQIRWRADFKTDGATRFSEVEGGLNQITIRRFERMAQDGPLEITRLEPVPIRGIGFFRHRPLREFLCSIVRCELRPAS